MTEFNDLTDALRNLITQRVQAKIEYTHGLLGDGLGRVKVPGRPDFSFVRPDRFSTRTAEIFNKRVAGPDGTPVIVGELPWEPGLTQVVDIDWETYKNAGPGWGNDFGGVGYHGQGHEWRDGAPGVDTFNVYRRQLGDLKTYPFSSGSTTVNVSSYSFNHLGSMKSWPGSTEFPLTNAVPGSTGTARFALVYWSPASGTSGFLGVATGTLGLDTESEILGRPLTPAGAIPSAYVRLAGGQTSITEFDIYDAREPWQPGIAFGTGNSLIHAGLIPISDTGGFYTGSTVEQALQEVAEGGVAKVSKLWNLDLNREIVTVDSPGDVTIATGSVTNAPQIQAVDASGLKLFEDGGAGFFIEDGGNIGAGTTDPVRLLHLVGPAGKVASAPTLGGVDLFVVENDGNANLSFVANTTGSSEFKFFASGGASPAGSLLFDHNASQMHLRLGGTNVISINGVRAGVGITAPAAKLHVDQSLGGESIPVLILDQADVSEEMIEFITTIGVGNAIEAVGVKTLTTTHFIKVTLPGSLTRYIPAGTIA